MPEIEMNFLKILFLIVIEFSMINSGCAAKEVIYSKSFIESVLLLILTAILTGFLVPYISSKLAYRKFKEQKLFEAEIARQSKIIESQNELLVELERLITAFRYRGVNIIWSAKSPAEYQESRKSYEDNAWKFFIDMETAIGKASRLTSPDVYKELEKFYNEIKNLDMTLVKLLKRDAAAEEFKEIMPKFGHECRKNLKKMLDMLAQDYGLSKSIKEE